MAALATALTEFADNGNSRTYTTAGSVASKPKLVLQSRKVPVGNQVVAEFSATVSHGTEDADGLVLPQKVRLTATCAYNINGDSADLAAALVIFRDIVASDEFEAALTSQNC
jgi:hypothetical protein